LDILFLNKKSNILLAIGAAILDPGPACSATTATAYFGSSTGPKPAKSEWSLYLYSLAFGFALSSLSLIVNFVT